MGMEGKRLKKCSTSTDVAVTADKKRLQKGKRKLDSLEKKKKKKKKIRKEKKQSNVYMTRLLEMMKWVKRRICVFGFDTSLPLDDIKIALTNHFGSCGRITRVDVNTICRYAHIDMKKPKEADQALTLHGSLLAGKRLEVRMARNPLSLYHNVTTIELSVLIGLNEEKKGKTGSTNPSY